MFPFSIKKQYKLNRGIDAARGNLNTFIKSKTKLGYENTQNGFRINLGGELFESNLFCRFTALLKGTFSKEDSIEYVTLKGISNILLTVILPIIPITLSIVLTIRKFGLISLLTAVIVFSICLVINYFSAIITFKKIEKFLRANGFI